MKTNLYAKDEKELLASFENSFVSKFQSQVKFEASKLVPQDRFVVNLDIEKEEEEE